MAEALSDGPELEEQRVLAPPLDDLLELLRIPSISADPAHERYVLSAAEWVQSFLHRAGGHCEIVDWRGSPLAVGELRASTDAADAPTVLCYGHVDVQPPEPLALWESPPFEPTVRGEWLYARGVADDKGQLWILLEAARQLAAEGALPVNVRFLCDGEEEVGGRSAIEFLEVDDGAADVCVIFDTAMLGRGLPVFNIATRGTAYFHVTVGTGARDLHSGVFGGASLNAVHALVQSLTGVLPSGGRLPAPLRAGILHPSKEELASWSLLPPGERVLADQGAIRADSAAEAEFYLRTWAEPAIDVHGVEAGSPRLQKTLVPAVADANLSMRLVAGQTVDALAPVVERLLRESAPVGAEVEVTLLSSTDPGIVAPDHPTITLGLEAFSRALGIRPLLVRSGGSLPIVPALARRSIPAVITGFDVPEGNIHAPNERFLVEHFALGLAAARELLLGYAGLR